MTDAIIMAGGSGVRSGQAVPKQFLTVNDIPIIVYTMMNLQKVHAIDRMVVVGPLGWADFIKSYAQQFNITKLQAVVAGGKNRNESIYNGLCCLKEIGNADKVCLIDANRPLIPEAVIQDVVSLADECDCALTLEPCYDSMFVSENGREVQGSVDRGNLFKGTTPECAKLDTLLELYSETDVLNDGVLSTSGLALKKGKKVLAAKGSVKCFKITTADDFELFKAFLNAESGLNGIQKEN